MEIFLEKGDKREVVIYTVDGRMYTFKYDIKNIKITFEKNVIIIKQGGVTYIFYKKNIINVTLYKFSEETLSMITEIDNVN